MDDCINRAKHILVFHQVFNFRNVSVSRETIDEDGFQNTNSVIKTFINNLSKI